MRRVMITLCLICCAGSVLAEVSQEKRALIKEHFKLTKQEEQYEKTMIASFEGGTEAAIDSNNMLTPDMKKKMRRGMERVKELMLKECSWKKIEGKMIELYAKHYTVDELKAINKVMATEAMQTYIDKGLAVLPAAAKIGQQEAMKLQGQIQRIMMEEMQR